MNGKDGSGQKPSNTGPINGLKSTLVLIIVITVISGSALRTAFQLGANVSHTVLKRHDKDARAFKKEMKKYKKELNKEQKKRESK